VTGQTASTINLYRLETGATRKKSSTTTLKGEDFKLAKEVGDFFLGDILPGWASKNRKATKTSNQRRQEGRRELRPG